MIICSIVLFIIIIFGIIDYKNEIHDIEKNQNIISKFLDAAVSLINKCVSGEQTDKEYLEIMSAYKQVDRILRVHCYHPSSYDVAYNISRNDLDSLYKTVSTLNQEVVSTLAEFELDRKKLIKQRLNVFNYFYRGVGSMLQFVFGYPIQMIKPSFDFESRGWNIFCAIIGLIGSLASILSFVL